MTIKSQYIKPKFKKEYNPKVGLLALTTDLTIEKDFNSIFNQLPIDVFVNRIHNENPLTKENLLKMRDQIEKKFYLVKKLIQWLMDVHQEL